MIAFLQGKYRIFFLRSSIQSNCKLSYINTSVESHRCYVERYVSGVYFQCSVIRQSKENQDRGIKNKEVNTVYIRIQKIGTEREGASEVQRCNLCVCDHKRRKKCLVLEVLYYLQNLMVLKVLQKGFLPHEQALVCANAIKHPIHLCQSWPFKD